MSLSKGDSVQHSAGGEGLVTKIDEKGVHITFSELHGPNFFPFSRFCEGCKMVFPSELIFSLHVGSGHKKQYPYS